MYLINFAQIFINLFIFDWFLATEELVTEERK